MPVVILVPALFLLMAGLGGFLTGFSLLPTDTGRAWLVAGATLLSGGAVSLVVGFGVGKLLQALSAGARNVPAQDADAVDDLAPQNTPEAAPIAAPEPAAPALAEPALTPLVTEPVFAEPVAPAAAPPETAKPRFRLPGMMAAGGALLGAGAGMAARLSPKRETPPAPEPEDPEKDLFADIDTLRGAEAAAAEPVMPDMPEAVAEAAPPLPEFDLRTDIAPPVADPVPPEPAQEVAASEESEVALAPDVAAAPVPGLIADDDLAALEFDTPPLAPLDTLDVVGAYDSGGVRFTMYSDGSVNAVGPGGERRFPTLEALRKHLDSGQSAV